MAIGGFIAWLGIVGAIGFAAGYFTCVGVVMLGDL